MKKLIYLEDAIEAIMDLPDCPNGYSDTYDKQYIIDTLEEVPAAEPEKVCIANITLSEEQIREAVEKAKNEMIQIFSSAEPYKETVTKCHQCQNSTYDSDFGLWFCDGQEVDPDGSCDASRP